MKLTALLTAVFAFGALPALACSYMATSSKPAQSVVAELPPLVPAEPATGS